MRTIECAVIPAHAGIQFHPSNQVVDSSPLPQTFIPVLHLQTQEIFNDAATELHAVFFEQSLDKGKIKTDLMGKMLGQAK